MLPKAVTKSSSFDLTLGRGICYTGVTSRKNSLDADSRPNFKSDGFITGGKMSKLNIRLTSVILITVVVVAVLLAFSSKAQASLGLSNEAKHCVMFLEPVAEDSVDPSRWTALGCYESFEEAISLATTFEAHQSDVSSSQGASSSEEISQAKANHCVIFLEPVPQDSDKPSNSSSRGCYESFAEAILVATDGVVKLDDALSPEELTQEMLDAKEMGRGSSSVVIGVDYNNHSFSTGTGSYTYNASGACTPSVGYRQDSMASDWNDAVSSARAYSQCHQFIHYEHVNQSGTSITCDMGNTCSNMGIMDNKTSSLRWRH